MPPRDPQGLKSPENPSSRGFTLLELLVAASITMLIFLFLASASHHAGQAWSTNDRKSRVREQARVALEMIGADLRQAILPLNPTETPGLQFVMNPSGLNADLLHRDALFWQAPLADVTENRGDLAALGYFVRQDGNRFLLCRVFIPSSDNDFLVYTQSDWISPVINAAAPADAASDYKGLFLENTPGLWIKAYRRDSSGNDIEYTPDSRVDERLPDRIELSITFFDSRGAALIGGVVTADEIAGFVSQASSAEDFIALLPDSLKNSTQSITIHVPLANRLAAP